MKKNKIVSAIMSLLSLFFIFIVLGGGGLKCLVPIVSAAHDFMTGMQGRATGISFASCAVIELIYAVHLWTLYLFKEFYTGIPMKIIFYSDLCSSVLFMCLLFLAYAFTHAFEGGLNF